MSHQTSIIVAVDAGRDGIKSMIYDEGNYDKFYFKSKYILVDFNRTKNFPTLNFDKDKDIIVKVDDNPIMAFGDVCYKLEPPDNIQFITTDSVYLEYSVYYTLTSVAKMLKENDKEVILGIDLTDNNIGLSDDVVNKLKGKHTVIFYKTNGTPIETKTFTITKVGPFHQGWVSIFNYAFDEDFNVIEEVADQDSIILDMGRRTICGIYTHQLSPTKTRSYNCGVEKYFSFIKDQLLRQHNIIKATHEIEGIISKNKTIPDVDFEKIKNDAASMLFMEMRNNIKEDFGIYSPDKIYITGGGTYLFKDAFLKIFPDAVIMDDPVFSNCKGLIKFMVRKFFHNKQGS